MRFLFNSREIEVGSMFKISPISFALLLLATILESIALFSILIHRLFVLQIVNGQKYAEDFELQITRTIREHNTRGNIYDCNGEVLAYNELVYTVTMIDDGTYASERERQLSINSVIYCVMKKLNENNEQINNELKIEVGTDGNYVYTVSGRALARFKADIFGESDPDDMTPEQVNMSANDMIQFLAGNSKFALYGTGKSFYSEEELQGRENMDYQKNTQMRKF